MQASRLDNFEDAEDFGELTSQEERFLNAHVVMGMNLTRAAKLAGITNPHGLVKTPRVAYELARLQSELQNRAGITREEIIAGIKRAVEQAEALGDPRTSIYGWVELNRMLGYDLPTKVKVEMGDDVTNMLYQLRQMDTLELLRLSGKADDTIDAEFYTVVKKDG